MKMAPENIPSLEALTRKFQNFQVGVLVRRRGLSSSQGCWEEHLRWQLFVTCKVLLPGGCQVCALL